MCKFPPHPIPPMFEAVVAPLSLPSLPIVGSFPHTLLHVGLHLSDSMWVATESLSLRTAYAPRARSG